MKRRVLTVALAAVLTLGCAAPAYAANYPYRCEVAGPCFTGVSVCRSIMQDSIMPAIQSLRDHVSAIAAAEVAAAEAAAQAAASSANAPASPQAAAQGSTAPQQAAASYGSGPCGYYVDANGDGICDYHNSNCWRNSTGSQGTPSGNSNGANGNGAGQGGQSAGNGNAGAGTYGYGYHHGGGHHGGRHHQ